MLLMTIDHTRDMFSSVDIGEHLGLNLHWAYYFTRWITHFCAPTFVFLSGLSIALWINKHAMTLRQTQWHIIKRGLFIILVDITLASLLWTIIEKQTVFVFYLSELWAIGCSMILLALLLKFSARTIFIIGITILCSQSLFQLYAPPTSFIATLLYGNNEFAFIPDVFRIVSNYPVLPWFSIACIGYAIGHYLTHTRHTLMQQTRFFILCALGSLSLFILLRIFNLYGETNLFVYHSGAFLSTIYSLLDVTKYPPSLQYVLITSLLTWCVLACRPILDRQTPHPILLIISRFGQTALLYYILHLTLICLYFILFSQIQPEKSIKTDNIFIIYGLTILVAVTAYPILLFFKKVRDKYKDTYPILGYV